MHPRIRQYAEICSKELPVLEPVYEFGALRQPGQEEIANLRPLFKNKEYYGTDIQSGLGVDIVLDLHKLNLPSSSVGTGICLETFEHVEYPREAILEVYRVLHEDGILLLSVPFNIIIHNHPYDYWRYTPDGVRSLLKPFEFVQVGICGDIDFPDSVVAIASKKPIDKECLDIFNGELALWSKRWSGPFKHGMKGFLKILVPPIALGLLRLVRQGRFWVR